MDLDFASAGHVQVGVLLGEFDGGVEVFGVDDAVSGDFALARCGGSAGGHTHAVGQRGTEIEQAFADELDRVLAAADRLTPRFRARTYRTYISLVAVTGMRRSEATSLDCSDVDWGHGLLTIREAKYRKARQLPLHPSTVAALKEYSGIRDTAYPHPKDPAVFLSTRRTRLIADNASQVFAPAGPGSRSEPARFSSPAPST